MYKPHLMEDMTLNEVRNALKRTKTVLVSLGVVEQHGYHLPLSSDIHNAYQIAIRISEKTGSLITPPLNYSFSGGTLPGTINISPQVMSLVVNDICQSLAEQGYKFSIMRQFVYDTKAFEKTCPNAKEVFKHRFTHLPLYDFSQDQLKYMADAVIESVKKIQG